MNGADKRMLEREALRNVIQQWNTNRLDLFELSEPNEDLSFHGVMRFYFQDSGQKVATKCIRVASDATVGDVIETLIEKFRPDMRMLSVSSYALYELHSREERKLADDEKPLLVQLNWHLDDREGRFLLKNADDKTSSVVSGTDANANFKRKLSKREKKELKKKEKLSRMKSDAAKDDEHPVAEKLYTELPETSFTRSISNPEAVMRRRRQQKLERKLQQFRSKDGGPDTGGTLKIYGESLCPDVPYKTLLLSINDCAANVVREMLDKYGLGKIDPQLYCLMQVNANDSSEYVLDDDECPLAIVMTHSQSGSIMFHVRRRPADSQPRRRKKKSGSLRAGVAPAGLLLEAHHDGTPLEGGRSVGIVGEIEVGSANGAALQLYGPSIQPRHCVLAANDGIVTLTPLHADAHSSVDGRRVCRTALLQHGCVVRFDRNSTFRFVDPTRETRLDRNASLSQNFDSASAYDRMPRGQEAILPAVLEFPEHTQQVFLQNVITRLDVITPAFKLAPVYTLYLCARYRASTHYRPELTPTERAHKLTVLLHHVASLIQATVQEKYSDAAVQAFWMANSSELLHFLKCDRHISAFTVHAQDILSNTVQAAFSNLVGCFHIELSQVLTSFLEETPTESEASGVVIEILGSAMALLRRCRVNAALTIQLFSQLFHYINVWCFNKVVTSSYMWCGGWGALISARLQPVGAWAERQGLELAADCHLALIQQCAHLLQAPKHTPEDIANLTSTCFKLNSVQLRCLLGGFTEETVNGSLRLPADLVEAAVKHAQGVADELHRADGREITLEESSSLPLSLLIPEDGFSADVVRGLPSGLTEFLSPLQRAGLCRLAPQPHSQGHWTVYMNGYNGNGITIKQQIVQQPIVEVIQLQKNSNGMGLSIVAAKGAGQSKLGIYIKSVVPGGAAAADQRLQAGDQLLAVDGNSLVGITQERAAEHLVRTGPVVTLHVAKQGAVLHGLATLLRQPSPQTSRGPRRMSERDLPSKVDMEQMVPVGHMANTVKSSKSVPALHEHVKHHEVFNPGYSRTSSNNSIPAMPGLKGKSSQNQPQMMQQISDQNSFYQNLSVYRNTGLGDRSSNLRNSQNNLQLQGQSHLKNLPNENQNVLDRPSGQRPQSAYYGNQVVQSSAHNSNAIRAAQSTKDLAISSENHGNYQVRGNFPSMPNVNQGYNTVTHGSSSQSYNQIPSGYMSNFGSTNPMHSPLSPISPNQHNISSSATLSNQYPAQMSINNTTMSNTYNQNQFVNQLSNNNLSNSHAIGNNQNLRGQAKLAEMSEEVTRRQQRGPMNVHSEHNLVSPLQQKRFQQNQEGYGTNNSINSNIPMSPTKQQPPVAPKPQGVAKREASGEMSSQDGPEGPPLPPTTTHPLFHQQQTDEDGGYLASSSDPPAVSFYPTQRPGQTSQSHFPPNPWEREEREKEQEARRVAARVWRDQQISFLQGMGEERRTPQQDQQLRALTLERDFERRAQEAQIDDDEKEVENRVSKTTPHTGLLRLANCNNTNNNSLSQDLNLVSVGSNIVSSIQPVSVVNSNASGGEQTQDNQQQESRSSQPQTLLSIQPKSILKSNLKLDNVNTNSPQSPSKSQKNASFSANLTPQNLKFDNMTKYDSKYDYNINNKFDMSHSKYSNENTSTTVKYDQNYSYNINNNSVISKFEGNISNANIVSPNQLSQAVGDLYVNSPPAYSHSDNINSNTRFDGSQFNTEHSAAPPPPERGSSFVIMSQQQAVRSNISSNQTPAINQNTNIAGNTLGLKDKRVSFHDNNDHLVSGITDESIENEMEPIREDPDRFILEAETMLQSPSTPTGSNISHTPGVIGAQEVYRDPRQRRLAEQQKAQQAGNAPIPEKLSFKEKMKMFALESGESNTPKDKVKISRAQRDIDAVH